MNIGEMIRKYRRKQELTQEKLAAALGVSAGAVSKWETNSSLPDTELLVPLARQLHVSLDELFDYQLSLSKAEIKKIIDEVTLLFQKQTFQAGLERIQYYCREFPHSEALNFQLAKLIWTYSFLTPFESEEEVGKRLQQAYERFRPLFTSENEQLRLSALYVGATILMALDRYDELEEKLQEIPQMSYDTFYMKLHVLEHKKKYPQAEALTVRRLFERVNEVISLAAILIRLNERLGNEKLAKTYLDLSRQLEQLFQPIAPSLAKYRSVQEQVDKGNSAEAGKLLLQAVQATILQPTDWHNHYLFSEIELSANIHEVQQSRKLFLQEQLNTFSKLSEDPNYKAAEKLVNEYVNQE
ncbi:helix-turn-helix domain-containing protein [Enterococcus sp. LJL128]